MLTFSNNNIGVTSLESYIFWALCFSGSDAILLGAETLRGLYPVETISIVGKISAEVNVAIFLL